MKMAEWKQRLLKHHHWRVIALASGIAAVLSFDVWLGSCGFRGCPTPGEIRSFRPPEGSRVFDRDGRMMGRLSYVRRVNVPLSVVPVHVQQAFLATEDRRFYEHGSADWRAAVRAAVRNTAARGIREGFSTITMQVARNSFARERMQERSLKRKLIELRIARRIEGSLTKRDVLELYLNIIYLGNGTYGVEAASRDLFGKSVADLSLAEGAMLAALPKGPSAYTPRHDPVRARNRRDLVLSLMAREGFITAETMRSAAREPVRVSDELWRPAAVRSYALDAVLAAVDSAIGTEALDAGDVDVYTTLDASAQRAAERAVHRHAVQIDREAGGRGDEDGAIQGAMIALDPRTGDLRALVGGRSYEPGGFDRALSARRQPGSAFKPFVYAAALAQGYTPATLVDDSPVEIQQQGRVWTPANYGGEYGGVMTLRRALMRSANAATVRVSHGIGEPQVIGAARRLGISSPLTPLPSIALGAMEVTPLELVTAYAPFANGGLRVHPRLVTRVERPDGRVLWAGSIASGQRVLDARDAFQLTSMLQSVVSSGTGRVVHDMGAGGGGGGAVAGKTGTTNDGTDVWFIGYTPTLVAGVWFGYDRPRPLPGGASGGRLAAPAWADFYLSGWREDARSPAWLPPPGLVVRAIDAESGQLATEWCPDIQREWFKVGTEPVAYCPIHHSPDADPLGVVVRSVGDKVSTLVRRIFHF
ncbi:MAG: PBP1A family penicillin-binding protein [Gemmatimonadota bacterium]|nr:PBP1A family penicillin-binding protein [Gemmatimonadota bacterium]